MAVPVPAQLLVDVDDVSLLKDLKRALRMMKGVRRVRAKKSPAQLTLEAIQEVESGEGTVCNSWNDFLKAIR